MCGGNEFVAFQGNEFVVGWWYEGGLWDSLAGDGPVSGSRVLLFVLCCGPGISGLLWWIWMDGAMHSRRLQWDESCQTRDQAG